MARNFIAFPYSKLLEIVRKQFKDYDFNLNYGIAMCLLALVDVQKGNTDFEHILEEKPFNKGYVFIHKDTAFNILEKVGK